MTERRTSSFAQLPIKKQLLSLLALCACLVLIALASPQISPFNSVEASFTDTSAHGMLIVPASCPSNPYDADAPNGCSGSTPLCPNGVTPAPNGDQNECTCSEGNTAACTTTPNGGGIGGIGGSGGTPTGGSSACAVGYTAEGSSCVFTGCPTGYTKGGTESNPSCVFAGCPSGYTQQGSQCVQDACVQGYICGADGNLYLEQNDCSATLAQTCSYGCSAGACFFPPASVDIIAVPSIVKTGETSEVSWKAANVQSCNITGQNGDSWSCTGSSCSATTTEQTSDIQAPTTYTLSCTGDDSSTITAAATVSVVPNFVEQ